ncbi:hypothetical protein [Micromonospora sp. I033]
MAGITLLAISAVLLTIQAAACLSVIVIFLRRPAAGADRRCGSFRLLRTDE